MKKHKILDQAAIYKEVDSWSVGDIVIHNGNPLRVTLDVTYSNSSYSILLDKANKECSISANYLMRLYFINKHIACRYPIGSTINGKVLTNAKLVLVANTYVVSYGINYSIKLYDIAIDKFAKIDSLNGISIGDYVSYSDMFVGKVTDIVGERFVIFDGSITTRRHMNYVKKATYLQKIEHIVNERNEPFVIVIGSNWDLEALVLMYSSLQLSRISDNEILIKSRYSVQIKDIISISFAVWLTHQSLHKDFKLTIPEISCKDIYCEYHTDDNKCRCINPYLHIDTNKSACISRVDTRTQNLTTKK